MSPTVRMTDLRDEFERASRPKTRVRQHGEPKTPFIRRDWPVYVQCAAPYCRTAWSPAFAPDRYPVTRTRCGRHKTLGLEND